ncbi:response regulator transcription factor [Bacillus piscicola]|uniref:response regulator transcription factor n=1 Tax=Bacillus piscicola TaxID=1632684 RepID=UPI001F09B502|nr:response regulator transcription factor [Bacillus piscicola]
MGHRILLVEDDPEIAFIIKDTLEEEGFAVTIATTGAEGWEDFQKDDYSLAIVDLMLPEMDGYRLCEHIRFKSTVPILMISARSADEDKVKGLSSGADDYLTKPFSLEELTARVRSHLRRHYQYHSGLDKRDVIAFEGLTIIPSSKEVKRKGKIIDLTGKEFELLYLFASNPHVVFSKQDLYEHIWHHPASSEGENTVTVHIRKLREKLQDHSRQPTLIKTVWGTGYKFIGEPLL